MDWPVALVLIVAMLTLAVTAAATVLISLRLVRQQQADLSHLARLAASSGDLHQAALLESVVAEAQQVAKAAVDPRQRPVPLTE
jgi:hypothetical protein